MQFISYEIVPLRNSGESAEQCEERNADFWGLFGIDKDENAYAIGDFSSKSDAEFIKGAINAS